MVETLMALAMAGVLVFLVYCVDKL